MFLAGIEMVAGCNRVLCTVCHTNLCWLCGAKLSTCNPYQHYREKGPCANRVYGAPAPVAPRPSLRCMVVSAHRVNEFSHSSVCASAISR